MKKTFFIYIMIFPVLFTIIPSVIALCTPPFSQPLTITSTDNETLPSSASTIISVLDIKTNTIKDTDLEEYLVGVLAAEMPASYEMEALKAQAVAARSYIIYKSSSPSACPPTHAQEL